MGRGPGIGSTKGSAVKGMRRIVIAFDDETFTEIRAVAVKRQSSFAAVVRELVEFGLLDIEDGS